jgi:hypothetical protein
MNKNLGFKIHPLIVLPNSKEDLWVGDAATGTGLFPLDIANDLPKSAHIFGFDITDTHFPTKDIPENVRFCQHDMRTPFPEEYIGKFDLVCIRLVQLGLRGEEWDLSVRQLVTLLSETADLDIKHI